MNRDVMSSVSLPTGRRAIDDPGAVTQLKLQLRRLLLERGNVRTRAQHKRWKQDLLAATTEFRGNGETTGSANGSKLEHYVARQWSASQAGTLTATGPEGERLSVGTDPAGGSLYRWWVETKHGRKCATGVHGTVAGAKREAEAVCPSKILKTSGEVIRGVRPKV